MSATQKLLRFGVFELNLDTEELRKNGTLLKLSPQPFQILSLLASRAGQIVMREEIRQRIWGGETYVDFEHGMNQCIKQIRNALGDNPDNPVYIETLPRRGYRFLAPVSAKTIPAPQPRVVESKSGELPRLPVLIGGRVIAPAGAGALAPSYPAAMPDAEARAGPVSEAADIPPSRLRRWRISLICIGSPFVLVALIAAGLYLHEHIYIFKPTGKDTIVLADFDNKTGDPVFDDTLKQELAIQLEHLPFLDALSDRKVAETLKLMNRTGSERLTEDVAHDVCLRTNSDVMLSGSIVGSGSQYVIDLKAVDCNTGDVLANAQEQAVGKEAVLKAMDTATWHLLGKLGGSLSSVQKYATPLVEATTPSLEALQAYSLGLKASSTKGDTAALPFFQRAVELDPNFARAYVSMSEALANLNERGRAVENARKAYELRDKVKSERERYAVETIYYLAATGELEKAAGVNELWQQTYPRDITPLIYTTDIYGSLGDWEKVLEKARATVRLDPTNVGNYSNLGNAYAALNRLDEADAVYKQAEALKLEGELLLVNRYLLAFLKADTTQMAQLTAAAMGKPGTEDLLLAIQAWTEAWHGKFKNARGLTRRAMDLARHNDAKEAAAIYQAYLSYSEVESGNREQAVSDAEAAVKLAANHDVRPVVALTLARTGHTAEAQKHAAELDRAFPLDTLVQRFWLPTIRAAI
ncbi:MAG: winged helix-turn-helix domain-containing protein, partial [Candidatus Korobacteraceae bacterium]